MSLDQDLIDTIKGSFPSWFSNSSSEATPPNATTTSENNNPIIQYNTITTTTSSTSATTPALSQTNHNNSRSTNSSPSSKVIKLSLTTLDKMSEGKRDGRWLAMQHKIFRLKFYLSIPGDRQTKTSSVNSGPPPLSLSDNFHTLSGMESRQSPPKAIVDSSPLQPAMDKNKECEYFIDYLLQWFLCSRISVYHQICDAINFIVFHCVLQSYGNTLFRRLDWPFTFGLIIVWLWLMPAAIKWQYNLIFIFLTLWIYIFFPFFTRICSKRHIHAIPLEKNYQIF